MMRVAMTLLVPRPARTHVHGHRAAAVAKHQRRAVQPRRVGHPAGRHQGVQDHRRESDVETDLFERSHCDFPENVCPMPGMARQARQSPRWRSDLAKAIVSGSAGLSHFRVMHGMDMRR